ncbi:MAG: hypothetical protein IPG48_05195 [Saprospiraceae bacterium]|nr:hypothetical protein [Saprospiraceae bacterium]
MGQKSTHWKVKRKVRMALYLKSNYQARRCEGCPLRGMCHKSAAIKDRN